MGKFLVALCLIGCSHMNYTAGVPNLSQVDQNIWRSGQITSPQGWDTIQKLAAGRHIHIVKLNFEAEGSDAEGNARGWDVRYRPLQPEGDQDVWDDLASAVMEPDPSTVTLLDWELSFAQNQSSTDFYLIHCTHGQDRTGYIVGRFRVLSQGWTKDRAYAEMRAHGFHPELLGLYEAWRAFHP